MKSGTTTLFSYLAQHPQIVGSQPQGAEFLRAQRKVEKRPLFVLPGALAGVRPGRASLRARGLDRLHQGPIPRAWCGACGASGPVSATSTSCEIPSTGSSHSSPTTSPGGRLPFDVGCEPRRRTGGEGLALCGGSLTRSVPRSATRRSCCSISTDLPHALGGRCALCGVPRARPRLPLPPDPAANTRKLAHRADDFRLTPTSAPPSPNGSTPTSAPSATATASTSAAGACSSKSVAGV